MIWLSYIVAGCFVGLVAGLFGVGGGTVMVPVLLWLLALHMELQFVTHMALGTSFAVIVFTSLSSLYRHHKNKAIHWRVFKQLTFGLLLGVAVGSVLALQLNAESLKLLIGVFLILVSLQMVFAKDVRKSDKLHNELPQQLDSKGVKRQNGFAGLVVGFISAFFGIGGGSLVVPYLKYAGYRMTVAVATSAATGMPIAVGATLVYGVAVGGITHDIDYAVGYVYLPALIGLSVTSIPFAQLGAQLAHKLNERSLKRVFAVYVFLVGAYILIQELIG